MAVAAHEAGHAIVGLNVAGLEYLEAEPQKAAKIMSRRLKLSEQDVLASYEGMELPTHAQNIEMLLEGDALLRELARIMS